MGEWAGRRAFGLVVDLARSGDEVAFAELWHWLHPPLLRWLRVVAPLEVDDVESEVWLSISRGLASFEGDERDFRGWVFTIARRRSVDWGRRRQRQPALSFIDVFEFVDPASSSSSLVDARMEMDAALVLLRELTPDQREVVALRVIVGMTVQETASIVNKTENSVRVLSHRGLRALQRRLTSKELADGGVA